MDHRVIVERLPAPLAGLDERGDRWVARVEVLEAPGAQHGPATATYARASGSPDHWRAIITGTGNTEAAALLCLQIQWSLR